MGRHCKAGGVAPKGDRIQVGFTHNKKQVRPTLDWRPTQANLARAAQLRERIVAQVKLGTFDFAEFFPTYRFLDRIAPGARRRTFGRIADDFFASIGGLEYATRASYRKIITFWKGVRLTPVGFQQDAEQQGERATARVRLRIR